MLISVIFTLRCTSGHEAVGVLVQQARVNRRSLSAYGQALGLVPDRCKECGADVPAVVESSRIADEDLAKVNRVRIARGWPVLKSAEVIVKEKADG